MKIVLSEPLPRFRPTTYRGFKASLSLEITLELALSNRINKWNHYTTHVFPANPIDTVLWQMLHEMNVSKTEPPLFLLWLKSGASKPMPHYGTFTIYESDTGWFRNHTYSNNCSNSASATPRALA